MSNGVGQKDKGIENAEGPVYPHIVVTDKQEKNVIMIGEVKTASTVNDGEADQWEDYIRCETFFLCVPKGYAPEATRILKFKNIQCSGLRTYAFDSEGRMVITDV